MFQVSVITKEGFGIIAGCLTGEKLSLSRIEYGDGVLFDGPEEVWPNNLNDYIKAFSEKDINGLVHKRCDLSFYEVQRLGNSLRIVGVVEPQTESSSVEFTDDFYAKEAAIYAKYNNKEVLFAYCTAVTKFGGILKDTSNVVRKNAVSLGPNFFITNLVFENANNIEIEYPFVKGYSMPTLETYPVDEMPKDTDDKIIVETGDYGVGVSIKDGFTVSENGEEIQKSREIILKHGSKGDTGEPFKIAKFFNSVKEIEDFNNSGETDEVENGQYVIVSTDVYTPIYEPGTNIVKEYTSENGMVFKKTEEGYVNTDFNMAGPQGAPGKNGADANTANIINVMYPTGSIYTTLDKRNPRQIFNVGWWKKLPPRITLQQVMSENALGTITPEGLPDIYGVMHNVSQEWANSGSASGAFARDVKGKITTNIGDTSSNVSTGDVIFQASKGEGYSEDGVFPEDFVPENRVFGRSVHVQPYALNVNIWIRVDMPEDEVKNENDATIKYNLNDPFDYSFWRALGDDRNFEYPKDTPDNLDNEKNLEEWRNNKQ